jgi:alpha,alpha-trehalose phosphorylase
MGSVWQALAYGFAGLDPLAGRLRLAPLIPAGWGALELALQFRAAPLRVRIERDVVLVTSAVPLSIEVGGDNVACAAGRTEIPYRNGGAQ